MTPKADNAMEELQTKNKYIHIEAMLLAETKDATLIWKPILSFWGQESDTSTSSYQALKYQTLQWAGDFKISLRSPRL